MRHLIVAAILLVAVSCVLVEAGPAKQLKELREMLDLVQRARGRNRNGGSGGASTNSAGGGSAASAGGPSANSAGGPSANSAGGGSGGRSGGGSGGFSGAGLGPLGIFTEEEMTQLKNFCEGLEDDDPAPAHDMCFFAKEAGRFLSKFEDAAPEDLQQVANFCEGLGEEDPAPLHMLCMIGRDVMMFLQSYAPHPPSTSTTTAFPLEKKGHEGNSMRSLLKDLLKGI